MPDVIPQRGCGIGKKKTELNAHSVATCPAVDFFFFFVVKCAFVLLL